MTDSSDAPQKYGSFDKYLLPVLYVLLFLTATQITIANLPTNKIFAGHDSGFYTLFPHQLIRTSSGVWEVKSAFGYPNFEALITLPYALADLAVHRMHLGLSSVGRVFYELELLFVEFGTFSIAWLVLQRTVPQTSRTVRAFAAFVAAFVATCNIYTAILLLYPPSNFQTGVMLWPVVMAFELYLLWHRPTIGAAALFGLILTAATVGNPVHTILGFVLVIVVYILNSVSEKRWRAPLLLTSATVTLSATAYIWMPAAAAVLLYHGSVARVEGLDAASLARSHAIIVARTSLAGLLRFDGLVWWPKTRNAGLYLALPMVVATFAPAFIAIFALFTRRPMARVLWVILLASVELAKGAHPPFGLNMVWMFTHIPLFGTFRETYDKFVLYVLLALPPAFALGLVYLYSVGGWAKGVAIAGVSLTLFSAWPFLAGRIAEPYFLTTVPNDYYRVDSIMGGDPQTRALSLPGGSGDIHITNWFKGGNFENFLFRAHVVNGAIFKHRSISAAPLYNDFSMQQTRELPELMDLLGIYNISYVILHKDYLTSYRMAFDYQPSLKVLGPLVANASERVLDRDNRLKKIYEGSNLVLYRVEPAATLAHVYGTYNATVQTGYENTLLADADAGLTDARRHPDIFFTGNQLASTSEGHRDSTLMQHAKFFVEAPIISQSPSLYPEQVSRSTTQTERLSNQYLRLERSTAYLFTQPHGDWFFGVVPPKDNISGSLLAKASGVVFPRLVVGATRVPREVFAQFFGSGASRPWPVTSFANEPRANDELFDGRSVHDLKNVVLPPVAVTSTAGRTSAVYQFQPFGNPMRDEYFVAGRHFASIPLLDLPEITLLYDLPEPDHEVAFLRFDLTTREGRRVYFDKELDSTGLLNQYSVRENFQAALERRFDQALARRESNPLWLASRKLFSPEHADDFNLDGVSLIMGKSPTTHAASSVKRLTFGLRGLVIQLASDEPPAYERRGYFQAFSAGVVGRDVSFKLRNGGLYTARVISESPNTYSVQQSDGARQRLLKVDIDSIDSIRGGAGSYNVKLNLPPLDIMKYPQFKMRYFLGSSNEEISLHLAFRTARGIVEIVPGLMVSQTNQSFPAEWIQPTGSFLNESAAIVLDSRAISPTIDNTWTQIAFDLRQVAAYRLRTFRARLAYVRVSIKASTGPKHDARSSSDFGFGDVSFSGQEDVSRIHLPRNAVLLINGKAARVAKATNVASSPDLLSLRFYPVTLKQSLNKLETNVQQPWQVRSLALVPPEMSKIVENPTVTVHHIDDQMFSIHIKAKHPAWIVFAETYNSGWHLTAAKPPSNRLLWLISLRWLGPGIRAHFMGNAYNNSWYIDSATDRDYVIDFAPQDFGALGMLVALAALFVSTFLAWKFWRR